MMSGWKLTKKLKESHPFSRSKSPTPDSDAKKRHSHTLTKGSEESAPESVPESAKPYEGRKTLTKQDTSSTSDLASGVSNLDVSTVNEQGEDIPEVAQSQGAAELIERVSPGLLTIKVYLGSNVVLPVGINNNLPVLHKLAENAMNVDTQSLSNNLLRAADAGDVLTPEAAARVLPSLIAIPDTVNLKKALVYLTVEFENTVAIIDSQGGLFEAPNFSTVSSFDVSRSSALTVNLFARLPSVLLVGEAALQNGLLIGTSRVPLNLGINSAKTLRLLNHQHIKLDREGVPVAEVCLSVDFKPTHNKPITIDDFDLLKVIGKGSFGKVMQVRKKDTAKIYALKTLRKSHIVTRREVTHTLAERTVLARVNNAFIVPLKFTFQSPEKLYLVLAFINGGELFHHLQKEGRFTLSRLRFYIAELLSALECLHDLNVIYRDLKPENILIDHEGHVALCDFGLCKLDMALQARTSTFCGTPEYLAPELLLNQGYTRVVDWWTLGVLLYEMLTGLPPYYDEDNDIMYKKILNDPLRFPSFVDKDAKDLLTQLLNRDPKKRLGCNGSMEIRSHPFFKNIDWVKLNNKAYEPPFKPGVHDSMDTSNFEEEFTNERPMDSVVDDFLSESVQKQFGGWTYTGSERLGESAQ
ncbi:hypothetical protein BABINDRAFT_160049 [Babjeviella inositovora NRRL Y-12698]|uniref:non-specific serine/threonine protein kinase n=1 Tax=Babjeviella inositovora NRRL Y-12698 TaxID=984486 RepID=A0A1E3QW18_9ASCO|nr:uncharacterized protein BABINDRAFT_160049 [Babjeviella inositovora NRRL Y-12698]ODQ81811.1 hypothetical protein BABINDRAFT_160049 [Babjeviella inositovora NRRL Y-12698]